MSNPQPEQPQTGDDITVGNIVNSKAVAIGRGAKAVVEEHHHHYSPKKEPPPPPRMTLKPPADFVQRHQEYEQLIAYLLAEDKQTVAITATLQGAGGFGKTTLAQAICHDERILDAFPDGILWATIGDDRTKVILGLQKLYQSLTGEEARFVDEHDATLQLSAELDKRRCLLVIDDVWNRVHLRPFLQGGAQCARLITTRMASVVPKETKLVAVDAMRPTEAVDLLGAGLDALDTDQLGALAGRLGEWPLLLKLVNRRLYEEVQRHGIPIPEAIAAVNEEFDEFGLTSFDADNAEGRDQAVAASMNVSLRQLRPDVKYGRTQVNEAARFRELAIFPEDAVIPVSVVALLWGDTGQLSAKGTSRLCRRLADLSLLLNYDKQTQTIQLHDVFRRYLIEQVENEQYQAWQEQLLKAYQTKCSGNWSHLPDDSYVYQNLFWHMREAGDALKLQRLVLDRDWLRIQEKHQPSLQNYLTGLDYALETAVNQRIDGLSHLVALGLIKGTLTTATYKIKPEQIKQMIESRQIDAIREWSNRLPQTIEWFRIDFVQLAGEVALLDGQYDRAKFELRYASEQLGQVAQIRVPALLKDLAIDFAMLNDKSSIGNLQRIAEEMPDDFWNPISQTITFLQEVYGCLDQGKEVDALLLAYGLEEYPAITRLTSNNYMSVVPESSLRAAESSVYMFARLAEILHTCEESSHALVAFSQAEKMLAFMKPDEPNEKTKALTRLAEVAAGLGQPPDKIHNLLNQAIDFVEQTEYSLTRIYAQIHLANILVKLGYTGQATQLLNRIDKQLWQAPNKYQKVEWLSRLAPCARFCSEPATYIASHIPDEQLRHTVILIWHSHLGDADATEALLNSVAFTPNNPLNDLILRAIIPFLEVHFPNTTLFKRAWSLSQQVLKREQQWQWLGKAITVVQHDQRISGELLQTLKTTYDQSSKHEQATLATQLAPLLVYLCTLDRDWSISVLQNALYRQEPYHRSVILFAIEQFLPMILKLAGSRTIVGIWDKINIVEQIFFQSSNPLGDSI